MEEKLPNSWILPTLAFGFILLVSFLFIAGYSPTQPQTKTTTQQVPTTQGKKDVSLALSPGKLDLKVGAKTTIPVNIESSDEVSAVEIHLTFDPKIVNIKDVAPLEFFNSPKVLKKEINNERGELIFTLGSLPARSGSGQLAQVSVVTNSVGKTDLKFSESSKAAIVGQATNALGKTLGTTINVVSDK